MHNLLREFRPYDARTETEDVHIVVFHPLVCGKGIVTDRRTDARKLGSCHACSYAAAADQNSSLCFVLPYSLRHGSSIIRIVDGILGVGPEVIHGMTKFPQVFRENFLEKKSSMVGTKSNNHMFSPYEFLKSITLSV